MSGCLSGLDRHSTPGGLGASTVCSPFSAVLSTVASSASSLDPVTSSATFSHQLRHQFSLQFCYPHSSLFNHHLYRLRALLNSLSPPQLLPLGALLGCLVRAFPTVCSNFHRGLRQAHPAHNRLCVAGA